MARFVLFPGRHHLLTRFQAGYLRELAGAGATTVVWAVTSANHENTKRNPVPYHRREAAIERFSVLDGPALAGGAGVRHRADRPVRRGDAQDVEVATGPGADPGEHRGRLLDAGGRHAVRAARLPRSPASRPTPDAGAGAPVGRAAAPRRRRRGLAGAGAPGHRRRLRPLPAGRARPHGRQRPGRRRRGRADRDPGLPHATPRRSRRRRPQVGSWSSARAARAGSSTSAAAPARCWSWPTASRRCARAT